MRREDLAAILDGREYLNEISAEEEARAKESGLVVVFGYSDDLIEFRGSIDDEGGCFDGGEVYFNRTGVAQDGERLSNIITVIWCGQDKNGNPAENQDEYKTAEGQVIAWCYITEIPHSTFMVYDEGEAYCRGIVFSIEDIK